MNEKMERGFVRSARAAAKYLLGVWKKGSWVSILIPFILTGCAEATAVSEEDQVAIYSAVVRRIYDQDDTFGGTFHAPVVYLLTATDDSVGDPDSEQSASQSISNAILGEVESSLADLPTRFVWVDDSSAVPLEATTAAVADNGVILTLGNIHSQADGTVLVSASIYIASLVAGGQTYIVEQLSGVWQITGITGVRWIS